MSDRSRAVRSLLTSVVDAGREVLRDLEDQEVPAKLKRVKRANDRTLPPPLAVTLLDEIEENEWFREKVVEAWSDADDLGAAFLDQKRGWWRNVSEALARGEEETVRGAAANAIAEAAELRDSLARARKRADQAEAAATAAQAELTKGGAAAVESLHESLAVERRAVTEERRRATDLESALVEAERTAAEADRTVARLFERYRRVRQERAALERGGRAGEVSTSYRSPAELAALLDRIAATSAPYREAAAVPAAERSVEPLRLPAGVAPDTAEAIESLADAADLVVLVDGYNVLGALDPDTMATGAARRRLIDQLARLLMHLDRAQVVVVFDSVLSGGRTALVSPSGVEVLFTDADESADDRMVAMAEASARRVVVITNDRELRERSVDHGSTVLWSTALTDWLRR